MKTVRFIMAIHNHQPVGNFEHVFRKACTRAYHPFLDVFDAFPRIRMVLHYSGPLLEWIEENDPKLVSRIKQGVGQNRFELLGSPYGEPILTMLPDRDALGQIRLFQRHLRDRYNTTPRGAWLAERVWESYLARILADAGVEYTVVDDFHFLAAGLRENDLAGYYTVEDQGRVLRVFSGSEFLRYAIPFGKPEDTIQYLRRFATDAGDNVIVFADDGEKFGLWPETHKHVYQNHWLKDFAAALHENRDWIEFTTFADVADSLPPVGRAYLPDTSYREMTEWAQRTPAQIELAALKRDLENARLLQRCRPFFRGGTWRNYKTKYTEAAQMYARMMEVSRLLADRAAAKNYPLARRELYRGQCNCAYWHGVFAGLYMPFLRAAVYAHLLNAENLVTPKRLRPGCDTRDFDLDGLPEIKLWNGDLSAYLKPDRGGALYELDHHPKTINLTNVMTRREEAYHARLLQAAAEAIASGADPAPPVSIHHLVKCKEPGLHELLLYDPCVRDSLIDRFLPDTVTPDDLRTCRVRESGRFAGKPYRVLPRHTRSPRVTLQRTDHIGPDQQPLPVTVSKRISLQKTAALEVRYALLFPEGAPPNTIFTVEWNLALSAVDAPDRNFVSHTGQNLGHLAATLHLPPAPALHHLPRRNRQRLRRRIRAHPPRRRRTPILAPPRPAR